MEQGEFKGISVDIWRLMLHEAGLDWEAQIMPPGRLYHSLTIGKGRVDAWISIEIESMLKLGSPVKPSLYPDIRLQLFAAGGTEPQ